MKRIHIKIFACIMSLFLVLFLFENVKREDISQKEALYSVSYDEYKEENWKKLKIFIPRVKDIGNQDLELAVNKELKREAITWLKDDGITFLNGHKPNTPKIWCQTNLILSIELSYDNDGGRFTSFVDQFINIDVLNGKELSFETLITNREKMIALLRDGKTVRSFGTIYDKNQEESDSYVRKRLKEMSERDLKRILKQCMQSQEDFALYDAGEGETTVENRAGFFLTKDTLVITYVESGYHYYLALELERLSKEDIINNLYL